MLRQKLPAHYAIGIMSAFANSLCRMPKDAWDSHVHVVDPSRYPLDANATYTPGIYTAWDNAVFENSIGASHNTIIQPSIYGNDNAAVLDALEAFGPNRSAAFVSFDPNREKPPNSVLEHWHRLGVRGIRFNLGFVEQPTVQQIETSLQSYADRIKSLGWAIQMYMPMSLIAQLEDYFLNLGIPLIFDHFGHPELPDTSNASNTDSIDPYSIDGFSSLTNLLRAGHTWVKISAPYRLSKRPGPLYDDLDPLIEELSKVAPSRLLFASDWPHTLFEGLDIRPWIEHVLDLVEGDESLKAKLFRDNAVALESLLGKGQAYNKR